MDRPNLLDRSWPLLDRLMRVHVAVYRATRGLIGHRIPLLPPMLIVEHVGARSGVRRRSALAYVPDGADLVLVASKGGFPKHPAWYHNLAAHPETTVQVGRERRAVRARTASSEERARLWPKAVKAYRGYEGYQRRAGREIPLVILEPRD